MIVKLMVVLTVIMMGAAAQAVFLCQMFGGGGAVIGQTYQSGTPVQSQSFVQIAEHKATSTNQ